MEKKPKVIFDSREEKSLVVEHLKDKCELEKKMLDVGDYVLSDRVACERKTTQDFVASIIDGRLFEQLKNLKDNFESPILIVEGNELYANENVNPNAIRGALSTVAVDFSIPIIWTKTPRETAEYIFLLAKREQFKEKRSIKLRVIKKPKSIKELQEYLIAGLPGIDTVKAKALLEHFKCPEFIFTASEKELRQVRGIGKELAKKIRRVIGEDYA